MRPGPAQGPRGWAPGGACWGRCWEEGQAVPPPKGLMWTVGGAVGGRYCVVPGRHPEQGPRGLLCAERPGLETDLGTRSGKRRDRVGVGGGGRKLAFWGGAAGGGAARGGVGAQEEAAAAPTSPSPCDFSRPSILAHQAPNAKKLKRKEQLWERLAKQGELPRDVRRAQARLLSPPVARAKPRPQDAVEQPFYDLWAKDSECPAVAWGRGQAPEGGPLGCRPHQGSRVAAGFRTWKWSFACLRFPFPSARSPGAGSCPSAVVSCLPEPSRPLSLPGSPGPSGSENQFLPGPAAAPSLCEGAGWQGAPRGPGVPHTGKPPAATLLPASTDPLERPLAGQDTFFLEQTKKKGVKVRPRCGAGCPGSWSPEEGLGAVGPAWRSGSSPGLRARPPCDRRGGLGPQREGVGKARDALAAEGPAGGEGRAQLRSPGLFQGRFV